MADNALIADAESILEQAIRSAHQQDDHDLSPLQRFYLGLLESALLPCTEDPEIAFTQHLLTEARKQWALRHLSVKALGCFLRREGCIRYRTPAANAWRFRPLREAREAWERRHGAHTWPAIGPVEWRKQSSTSSISSTW